MSTTETTELENLSLLINKLIDRKHEVFRKLQDRNNGVLEEEYRLIERLLSLYTS